MKRRVTAKNLKKIESKKVTLGHPSVTLLFGTRVTPFFIHKTMLSHPSHPSFTKDYKNIGINVVYCLIYKHIYL